MSVKCLIESVQWGVAYKWKVAGLAMYHDDGYCILRKCETMWQEGGR